MSDLHEVTDEEEYPHIRVHNLVVDEYLRVIGPDAFAVYAVLKRRANSTRRCFPGMKHIAELSGMSRPTVIKAIKTLETHRLISVEHRMSEAGDATSNLYRLHNVTPLQGSQSGLPPTGKVVNSVYHPVNAVEDGTKHDLSPVVNVIDSNKHQSERTSNNQHQQHTPSPLPIATAPPANVVVASPILSVCVSPMPPMQAEPKVVPWVNFSEAEQHLCDKLLEIGVHPDVAENLVRTGTATQIRAVLESEGLKTARNKAGFARSAIEKRYTVQSTLATTDAPRSAIQKPTAHTGLRPTEQGVAAPIGDLRAALSGKKPPEK